MSYIRDLTVSVFIISVEAALLDYCLVAKAYSCLDLNNARIFSYKTSAKEVTEILHLLPSNFRYNLHLRRQ